MRQWVCLWLLLLVVLAIFYAALIFPLLERVGAAVESQ